MNFLKKLLLNISVFLFSGALCWALGYPDLTGRDAWRYAWCPFAGLAAWPCMPLVVGVPFERFANFVGWPGSPWPWLALAAVLLFLFARQFWTSSRRAVVLGVASAALWCPVGLFLLFYYFLVTV